MNTRRILSTLIATTALLGTVPIAGTVAAPFTLQPKDHICIIGNTLADRMQYDGWLETLLNARFPKHELVIRNLGYTGDEAPAPK